MRDPEAPGRHRPALITAVLSCATFTAGVAEYVLTGQLGLVARGLGVSEATTGRPATVFALAYGLLTPILVVMGTHPLTQGPQNEGASKPTEADPDAPWQVRGRIACLHAVGPVGLEPTTNGLKVHCSAN